MKPLSRRSFRLGCESLESRDTPSAYASVATGSAVGDAPYVTVYDNSGTQLAHFLAYDASYTGGVNVATGDVNHDGYLDIITAPKSNVANIRVYDGKSFQLINSFNAFDTGFTGGASVTVASLYTDGSGPDIIVGAGAGGGPNVRVFNAVTGALKQSFYAFDPGFKGGVNVAATDAIVPATIPSIQQPVLVPPPGPNYVPIMTPMGHVQYTPPPPTPGTIITAAGVGGGPR